jgi:DNA-binding transcriptional MerR regulator/effector-binding domain-containing protein
MEGVIMKEVDLIQIGEFAKICNVSVQSLHYYDKIDYIKPVYIDPETNYRYYSNDQVLYLLNTKLFQSVGFKLKEIKEILKNNSIENIMNVYYEKQKELETEIYKLQEIKNRVTCFLDYFGSMLNASPVEKVGIGKIKLKEMPGLKVVYIRNKVSYDYPSLMFFYNQLLTLIFEKNIKVYKELITIFHDSYTDIYHKRTDIELAMAVKSEVISNDFIRDIPYNLYVTCIHQGKYPTSLETYKKMLHWIEKEKYRVIGPVSHALLVPIAAAKVPEDTVFEIRIPVEKKLD